MDTGTILTLTFFSVVIIGVFAGIAASGKLQAAKIAYQDSLRALKSDPTNPDLRQKTLELGRAYSQLTRRGKRVALFDEMALANDLNAAAGGSTLIAPSRNANPTAAPELDRLRKLDQLKEGGLVSEEEYVAKRQKIIDDL